MPVLAVGVPRAGGKRLPSAAVSPLDLRLREATPGLLTLPWLDPLAEWDATEAPLRSSSTSAPFTTPVMSKVGVVALVMLSVVKLPVSLPDCKSGALGGAVASYAPMSVPSLPAALVTFWLSTVRVCPR